MGLWWGGPPKTHQRCFGEFRVVSMAFCGYLGPSGRRLGVVLEASWGRLGPSWERLGGVLGASWCVLGASWRRLGGGLGASWVSWRALVLDFHAKRCLHVGLPF